MCDKDRKKKLPNDMYEEEASKIDGFFLPLYIKIVRLEQ